MKFKVFLFFKFFIATSTSVSYHHRKSWKMLFAFHIALIYSGKRMNPTILLQVSSRAASTL